MTRFDFNASDDDSKDHAHIRCWSCTFFKPIGEFGPAGKAGICEQPSSTHYSHAFSHNHCICPMYAPKSKDGPSFGWRPNPVPEDKDMAGRDDSSITERVDNDE